MTRPTVPPAGAGAVAHGTERDRPLHVLVVAACPFPAGRGSQLLIERSTLGLLARGHRVELLAARGAEAGRSSLLRVTRAGLPFELDRVESRVSIRRAVDDALIGIAALRLRRRPDVLLGHNLEGGLIAGLAGRALGRPSVWVRHSEFAEELGLGSRWPFLARAAGSAAERLTQRLSTRRVSLVPPPEEQPVDPSVDWIPPPADLDEAPIEPANTGVLYYEGNRDRYQNPDWLEPTLARVRERHPAARLVLASSPAERPRRADLALIPRTLAGGFPMKLVAHQVSGLPALCTARGAPGMVDGLDAFVLDGSATPERFAERAADLLARPDELARVSRTARSRAIERCHPAQVAESFERTLRRAIDGPRARDRAPSQSGPYTSRTNRRPPLSSRRGANVR